MKKKVEFDVHYIYRDDYIDIFGEDLYDTKNVIFTRYKKSPKVFKKIF